MNKIVQGLVLLKIYDGLTFFSLVLNIFEIFCNTRKKIKLKKLSKEAVVL